MTAHRKFHAADHTNGNDDIQSATNAQKGLATAAQITDLEAATDHVEITAGNPHGTTLEDARTAGNTLDGDIDMGGNIVTGLKDPVDGTDAVCKSWVENLVADSIIWQDAVKNFYDPTSGLPGSPTTGVRYIASATANGWTKNYIYEYDGADWIETVAEEGMATWVKDLDARYVFNGTNWVVISETISHNSLSGLQGGQSSEYYHLKAAQHTEITTFFDNTAITYEQANTLIGSGDANTLHHHDSRYYQKTEFIATTAGAGDAGKPIKTNTAGKVDSTFYDSTGIDHTQIQNRGTNSHSTIDSHIADTTIHFTQGSIDHGSIAGLGDDDHSQYLLVNGTRAMTGNLNMGTKNITNAGSGAFAGEVSIKVYSQATQPVLAADNNLAMWIDTSDSNAVYLIFRRGSSDQVLVELA